MLMGALWAVFGFLLAEIGDITGSRLRAILRSRRTRHLSDALATR